MINTKKLNAYMASDKNSPEMKNFVQNCVNTLLEQNNTQVVSTYQLNFLKDLGLLKNESKNIITS